MSLSQCHAEVVFELFQNGVRDTGGVLVGERAVVRAQLKAERNALLARCNAGAAVDIKQLDGAQQLAARLLDAGFEHTDGHRLVAHQRQIAADGRELGQAVEHTFRCKRSLQAGEVQLRDVDLAVDAVALRDQRVDLTDHAELFAVDDNIGAAADDSSGSSCRRYMPPDARSAVRAARRSRP